MGKRIEFDNSTLMCALLNGLKPAIKGQVLAKKPTIVCGNGRPSFELEDIISNLLNLVAP